MAFGADAADIVRQVVTDSTVPLVCGLLLGLSGAWMSSRLMTSFLFETEPTDATAFIGASVTLAVAALFAAWIPARRAAHVDPLVALRYE